MKRKFARLLSTVLLAAMMVFPVNAAEIVPSDMQVSSGAVTKTIRLPSDETAVQKKTQTVSGTTKYVEQLGVNDFDNFSVDAKTDGDGSLVYESSDTTILQVDSEGKVQLKGFGTAYITVYAEETDTYSKSNDLKIKVNVKKYAQSIKVDEPELVFRASSVKKKSLKMSIRGFLTTMNSDGSYPAPLYYKKISGSKAFSIGKKTGKVTVAKGTKAGVYKIKVKMSTAESDYVEGATLTKTIKIIVASEKTYLDRYCQAVADNYTDKSMDVVEKLMNVSYKFTYTYTYGSVSDLNKCAEKETGTCWSAGKILAKVCQKLGYKAKLRFAANDKMSRYPTGIYFASQHYNVKVVANGRTYYIDATPGTYCVYVCSSKKTLFYQMLGMVIVPYSK